MWFIADLVERYTTSVANTFLKAAAREADANRRALDEIKAKRQSVGEVVAKPAPAPLAAPRVSVAPQETVAPQAAAPKVAVVPEAPAAIHEDDPELAKEYVAAHALHVVKADRQDGELAQARRAAAIAAQNAAAANSVEAPKAMPMGVRADVVIKWLKLLGEADRRQVPLLLEKMRKDKKVRVPELQMICAEALGETPQVRKKGDHLAVLKAHFVPAERVRPSHTAHELGAQPN